MQREPAQGGTDDGASVQFEAVARAAVAGAGQPGGAPAGSGGAAGAMSGADLDELSRRLYSRLRIQLQQELRLDRERVGQIMNRR